MFKFVQTGSSVEDGTYHGSFRPLSHHNNLFELTFKSSSEIPEGWVQVLQHAIKLLEMVAGSRWARYQRSFRYKAIGFRQPENRFSFLLDMRQKLRRVSRMTLAASTVGSPARTSRGPGAALPEYNYMYIDGMKIFYRERFHPNALPILLLHGFPSSSRMFEPLFKTLPDNYHLIAPDYPGFGHSDAPPPSSFAYTFDHIAEIIDRFTERLELSRYVLYLQDYGGPVGFRLAVKHPERILGIIIQNAVAHDEGLGELWKTRRAFWKDRPRYENDLRANFLSLEATRGRHVGSDPQVNRYNPDLWTDECAFLNSPGQSDIQIELFFDYRSNVASYQSWQEWMRQHQPKMLVVWGKYDPSFDASEPDAFKRDLPSAEIHLVDGGHFALDTAVTQIASLVEAFISSLDSGEAGT